jgi:hypothetical protein
MDCKTLKDQMTAGGQGSPEWATHLSSCRSCAAFAARIAAVRLTLRDSSSEIASDAAFPARVLARLPRGPELLGWAALRALPAALLLALTLAWMSSFEPPAVDTLLSAEPSADLLLTTGALAPEVHR